MGTLIAFDQGVIRGEDAVAMGGRDLLNLERGEAVVPPVLRAIRELERLADFPGPNRAGLCLAHAVNDYSWQNHNMDSNSSDLTFEDRKARLQAVVKELGDNPKSDAFTNLLAEASREPEVLAEKNSEKRQQLAWAYAGFHELPPKDVCTNMQTPDTYCRRKLLQGSTDCYWHSIREDKADPSVVESYFGPGQTIGQAVEVEVRAGRSLANIYLSNVGLGGASNLTGAVFSNSLLTGVHFAYAVLDYAKFDGANLESSNLAQCSLQNVNFHNANLHLVKFRNNRFTGSIGLSRDSFRGFKKGWLPHYSMLESFPEQSEPMYRLLCLHFSAQSLFDDASWAAYRACVLRRKILRKKLSPLYLSVVEGMKLLADIRVPGRTPKVHWRVLWIISFVTLIQSLVLESVIGYGEKPLRVVSYAIATIIAFALIYFMGSGLSENSFADCLYFSLVTFTTLGYGDVIPKRSFRLVAASEALLGILLCGLLLFCFSRRSVGRS